MRLAANGKDGFPVVASHWFLYDSGKFYCALHDQSHMARLLSEDPSVGFEIAPEEPPYKGVRGAGRVRLTRDGALDMLETLLLRYLGSTDSQLAQWLLSRAEHEWLVEITPSRVSAWDYS